MDLKLPALGEGADSGTVVNLFVKEGDQVAKDQAVLELENEKAVATIPATAAGTRRLWNPQPARMVDRGGRGEGIPHGGARECGLGRLSRECGFELNRRRLNLFDHRAQRRVLQDARLQQHRHGARSVRRRAGVQRAVAEDVVGHPAVPAEPDAYEPLSLDELEKRHIERTLAHTEWNKSQAAAILQIERSTLDRKIKGYHLSR